MAIVFPPTPAEGQVLNVAPGKSFVFKSGLWRKAPMTTAMPKNYIVNPCMQISQQNVNTADTTYGHHAADQWFTVKVHSTGTITTQRVQSLTPKGAADRFRITITAADTALAAGEYLAFQQDIEGLRVADLLYGTANARQVILRFGFKGPAGTYAAALRNYPATRSYIALFAISAGQANTDTEQILVIPGATDGIWLTDNGKGLSLNVTLAWGDATGAAGWQTGEIIGTPAVSTGMSTAGAIFELFDVGFYADPYKTGVAPPFKIPVISDEMRRCQRYWYRAYGLRGWTIAGNWVNEQFMKHPAPMRATPAAAIVGAPAYYDGAATSTASSVQANTSNRAALSLNFYLATSALTAGRIGINYFSSDADYVAVSARL